MSTQDFEIKRGRAYDIVVTVSGIGDWTGLFSKMYWRENNRYGGQDLTLPGTISGVNNTITFPITAAISSSVDAGNYNHEVVIYNAGGTIVYAPLDGNIKVTTPIVEDPT